MIREKQIENAALGYVGDSHGFDDIDCVIQGIKDDFSEDANWAGSHPNWYKCSEELPEPNVPVLAVANADTESFQFVGYYDDDEECWRDDLNDEEILASIDYWTELPQPPKFD